MTYSFSLDSQRAQNDGNRELLRGCLVNWLSSERFQLPFVSWSKSDWEPCWIGNQDQRLAGRKTKQSVCGFHILMFPKLVDVSPQGKPHVPKLVTFYVIHVAGNETGWRNHSLTCNLSSFSRISLSLLTPHVCIKINSVELERFVMSLHIGRRLLRQCSWWSDDGSFTRTSACYSLETGDP